MKKNYLIMFLCVFLVSLINCDQTQPNNTLIVNQTIYQNITMNSQIEIPQWLNSQEQELKRFQNDSFVYYITSKGNKIWSGALNLAWNQIKDKFTQNQNLTFKQSNSLQNQIVEKLNGDVFNKKDVSENSYYINSGFGQATVRKINKELRQKFPQRTFKDLNPNIQDTSFISFAYLFKKLNFKHPFSKMKSFYFNGKLVDGFKAENSKQKSQLYYRYYNSYNDFLMGIETENGNDEILLLRLPNQQSQNYSVHKIHNIIKFSQNLKNKRLTIDDEFKMPVLNFTYQRNMKELKQMQFTNVQLKGAKVSEVTEKLLFVFDYNGIKVQNQAQIILGIGFNFNTKYFHVDGNFWVILKQKNKRPYLIMNVNYTQEEWTG